MTGDAPVLHAYGVVPADAEVELPSRGVDGAPVQLARRDDLAAIVSPLDGARYGEEVWRAHAEDPDWLTEFALAHQDVLSAVATSCDVLPFRIPGMYADEHALLEVVAAERDLLLEGLAAVRGRVEWGVKVFWTGAAEEPSGEARPASGRDYLQLRAQHAGSRERAAEDRRSRVVAAYERIAGVADDSVTSPPQDPALSRRREPMLLNSAHLVPRDDEEPFFATLAEVNRELAPSGLLVEVSGPWPPYSFVGGRHRAEEPSS